MPAKLLATYAPALGWNPVSTPYVGWLCCWFSPLLRKFFLWELHFSPSPQKPTFPNYNSNRNQVDEEPRTVWMTTSKSLLTDWLIDIYLFITRTCCLNMKSVLVSTCIGHVINPLESKQLWPIKKRTNTLIQITTNKYSLIINLFTTHYTG